MLLKLLMFVRSQVKFQKYSLFPFESTNELIVYDLSLHYSLEQYKQTYTRVSFKEVEINFRTFRLMKFKKLSINNRGKALFYS